MRGFATAFLLLAGFAYLAYKAEYLALDAPDALKALIVSPGAALLVVATFVGFPNARRRLGGTLAVLGLVAVLWATARDHPHEGWTFYGPYPATEAENVFSSLGHQPYDPRLVAIALLLPIGLALLTRHRTVPVLLLSLAALTLVLPPSRVLLGLAGGWPDGMPRRSHYYYFSPDASTARLDAAIPATLGVAGIVGLGIAFRRKP